LWRRRLDTALVRRRRLVVLLVLLFHLLVGLGHLFAFHVLLDGLVLLDEIEFLDVLHLVVDSFDFELGSIHLGLVVLQLLDHFLELVGPFLQVLLVYLQLFSDFRSALLGQDVLQLDIELLLLLDKHILL